MPYEKRSELPDSVKDNLPEKAQDIFKEAFNNAWEQYKDPSDRRENVSREETAMKIAWAAVKQKYRKQAGKWVKK
ncbi:MAG: ChaB family protein [Candidatus Marinimicrobia bacterium]|nr:ChaB family protein [Candidatus Neomarinimicrobiota bacterium]